MSRILQEEFEKHPNLIVREEAPFNAEPPLDLLNQTFVTPNNLFFVRNHGTVPEVDSGRYRLSVTGMVQESLNLSLEELRNNFPKRSVMATLQCAGNRRNELAAIHPIHGVAWQAEAIGNAVWSGVSLRDVLLSAQVDPGSRHVAFTGLDEVEKEGPRFGFGGSIPIDKALSEETILCVKIGPPLDSPLVLARDQEIRRCRRTGGVLFRVYWVV